MSLTTEQLKFFGDNGYIVLPNVVPPSRLSAALTEVDNQIAGNQPPVGHTGFHFLWCNDFTADNPMLACLTESPAMFLATPLVSPHKLAMPGQIQIALNIPHWDHAPGGPHLDGLTPPPDDGVPGTFTLLAGIFLTDQCKEWMGNVWVWPGSHRVNGLHFAKRGVDALIAEAPYPPTKHPNPPVQIKGKAGDLFLAHYLLGHNIGGNTSDVTRKVLYFRLQTTGHRQHWQRCITDPLFEFVPVHKAKID